mmetsp:Transcript_18489/g.30650  ORF Transcript_18489/g.30650 Transcript_18489/m.30650 type:complete len:254 (-) Transcript_18489:119-880(-)
MRWSCRHSTSTISSSAIPPSATVSIITTNTTTTSALAVSTFLIRIFHSCDDGRHFTQSSTTCHLNRVSDRSSHGFGHLISSKWIGWFPIDFELFADALQIDLHQVGSRWLNRELGNDTFVQDTTHIVHSILFKLLPVLGTELLLDQTQFRNIHSITGPNERRYRRYQIGWTFLHARNELDAFSEQLAGELQNLVGLDRIVLPNECFRTNASLFFSRWIFRQHDCHLTHLLFQECRLFVGCNLEPTDGHFELRL